MAEPGWYRDPEGTAPYRWWDGECWTAWQTTSRSAGTPPPGPVERVAPSTTRARLGRTALVVVTAVVVLLAAATVYGWHLRALDKEAAIAALPSALGSPAQDPLAGKLVTLDKATQIARVTTISSIALPTGWTTSVDTVGTATWQAYVMAYDADTPEYTADSTWRPVTVAYGLLASSATVVGDMEQTAALTMATVPGSLYGKVTGVTQSAVTTRAVTDYPGRLAGEATSTITYPLGSKTLTAVVTVVVVQQSVRAVVAVVVVDPVQGTATQRQLMADARGSLWVK